MNTLAGHSIIDPFDLLRSLRAGSAPTGPTLLRKYGPYGNARNVTFFIRIPYQS